MKLAVRLILLVLFTVLGLWLWSMFFPGPEKAIRQHLAKTARAASFTANEGPMDRLGNISAFASCFSPDADVKFESPGGGIQSVSGRDDILRAGGMARTMATALQVDFLDAILVLGPDRETATVDLTVRATVPGDRDFFVQEMKVYLKKFGRSWLIIRAETVKTLSVAGLQSGGRFVRLTNAARRTSGAVCCSSPRWRSEAELLPGPRRREAKTHKLRNGIPGAAFKTAAADVSRVDFPLLCADKRRRLRSLERAFRFLSF